MEKQPPSFVGGIRGCNREGVVRLAVAETSHDGATVTVPTAAHVSRTSVLLVISALRLAMAAGETSFASAIARTLLERSSVLRVTGLSWLIDDRGEPVGAGVVGVEVELGEGGVFPHESADEDAPARGVKCEI